MANNELKMIFVSLKMTFNSLNKKRAKTLGGDQARGELNPKLIYSGMMAGGLARFSKSTRSILMEPTRTSVCTRTGRWFLSSLTQTVMSSLSLKTRPSCSMGRNLRH